MRTDELNSWPPDHDPRTAAQRRADEQAERDRRTIQHLTREATLDERTIERLQRRIAHIEAENYRRNAGRMLAATVASLTEQWGVEARQSDEEYGWLDWHLTIPFLKNRSRESCEAFIEGRKNNPGFEYRLVRQYVSPTEVLE